MSLSDLSTFVGQRQRVWHRRHVLRLPPPWTDDAAIRDWRFTNLQREVDRGTVYLIRMLDARADAPLRTKIANAMLYRWINNWETWEECFGWLSNPDDLRRGFEAMRERRRRGNRVFTSAWVVPTCHDGDPIRNLERSIVSSWSSAAALAAPSMPALFEGIRAFRQVGPMIGWQMALDVAYLRDDLDDDTWVPEPYASTSSSGSAGGARLVDPGAAPKDTLTRLRATQEEWLPEDWAEIRWDRKPVLSLADIEHTLCEFRKWMGIRAGGNGKRRYRHDPRLWRLQ